MNLELFGLHHLAPNIAEQKQRVYEKSFITTALWRKPLKSSTTLIRQYGS